MFRMVPFAFSVEKSTPAGKKYTSSACGACDKSQLWQEVGAEDDDDDDDIDYDQGNE